MKSGWIILDKPVGVFSRTAGARVARLFGVKKVGHIGTLDPMASGVLPIAIGDATKMIPFVEELADSTKEYEFSCVFGFETDTLDITGHELCRTDIVPSVDAVRAAAASLVGNISQIPPVYSAVHVGGVRAYELARRGNENIEIKPRQVTVHSLYLVGVDGDTWHFRTRVSRGTYVRALARDIAKNCGTIATVNMIRRTLSNGFTTKNTQKLDFLESLVNNNAALDEILMPTDFGLGDIPVCNLNDELALRYRNGGFIKVNLGDGRVRVYTGDVFIGVGDVIDCVLRPKRTI